VMLTLDTAPVHLGEKVIRACSRANMFLHCAGAHDRVATAIERLRLFATEAVPAESLPFPAAFRSQRTSVHRAKPGNALLWHSWCRNKEPWAFAFARRGMSSQQELVGQRLREHLRWDTEPAPVIANLPSLAQLQAEWITGRHI
jgi:hypothetical protein